LPPVSSMFKQKSTKMAEGEPADALPWKPSAPTPGVFKRASGSPASAVRHAESNRDRSLADACVAGTLTASHSDRTEVDTVDELSLSGAESPRPPTPALDDGAREISAPEFPSSECLPNDSPRRRMPRAAWLLVATCGVVAIAWGALPGTLTRDALATQASPSRDAVARAPSAASPSQEAPRPQLPAAVTASESVHTNAEPGTSAGSPEPSDDEADEEGSDDATHAATAVQARELVEQGRALQKRKKYGQAEERYREALEVVPGYARALKGLVHVAMAQRKGKQAIVLAKQLQRARPGQVAYLVLLGDAYDSAGKRKEARETWQTAARKGSATARARLKRS
jgi:hypothetical protein